MLRMMLGTRRFREQTSCKEANEESTNDVEEEDDVLEPWVDFVRRVTHDIEGKLKRIKSQDWATLYRLRKARLAKKLNQCTDMRWSKRLINWKPIGARCSGGQWRRWYDCLDKYFGAEWLSQDWDDDRWAECESFYIERSDQAEVL